jgi:hypothetical protein
MEALSRGRPDLSGLRDVALSPTFWDAGENRLTAQNFLIYYEFEKHSPRSDPGKQMSSGAGDPQEV